ncbi:MAG: Xaa-Pro dipeptidase, partial [Woeseiaceae bacterium]
MKNNPDFNGMLGSLNGVDASTYSIRADDPKFAEFPVSEYKRRYARAIRLMEESGFDALILTHEINVRYFAGYLSILWESRFRSLILVLPRDPKLGPTILVPGQESGNAFGTSWVPDRVIYPDQENVVPYAIKALQDKGLQSGRLGMELGFGQRVGMTQEDIALLYAGLPKANIESATPLIQTVRMIKSPLEIDNIRRACEISQLAVKEGFSSLHVGMTEKQLAANLGSKMFQEGAELSSRPSMMNVSSFPGRPKMVNSLASDHALCCGDVVMLDGGATYSGYATDFIRQACLGPPTSDQRRWFDIA